MPKKDKKKRGLDLENQQTQSEPCSTVAASDTSDSESCSSPPFSLTDSPVKKTTKGSGVLVNSPPVSGKTGKKERRRSEVGEIEFPGNGRNSPSSPKTTANWDSGHRRSNPSISPHPLSSPPPPPSSSSASLFSSSSPGNQQNKKKQKTKSSFFAPNVLASQSNPSTPIYHKDMIMDFSFQPHDIKLIAKYLVGLHIRQERREIACFFCAFSNFGIDKVALFLEFKALFEVSKLAQEEYDKIYEFPTREQLHKGIASLLRIWMALSSSLYSLQFQKLFNTVVEMVRLDDDIALNPLRLMLIKGKSSSQIDSELPLMRSITEGQQKIDKDKYFLPRLFCKGYSVVQVANALTVVMFRVFKSIGPAELHDGAWEGKNKASTGPHLHALSLLFNRIAFLCEIEVLYAPEEERVESLLKCIELAQTLEKMNNFEGMAAVTSVFSMAPIDRLKPLWNGIGSKMAKKAKKLQELLQPVKNYKAYQNVLNSREVPILPWLAPKLRELRFMYDGNKRENVDGLINYDFLQMLGKSINEYFKYKDTEFSLKDEEGNDVKVTEEKLVADLEDVFVLDADLVEDTLYEKSVSIYSKGKK